MKEILENRIIEALKGLGIEAESVNLEHPSDLSHGDYASSVALQYAKQASKKPQDLAQELVLKLEAVKPDSIEKIEIAGPGFINFFLSKKYFAESLKEILEKGDSFGKGEKLKGEKVMIEYTDPNPFKEFHIGHLMSNAVGEALSRVIEWNGAEVVRACYQGDVGMHVAKAIWGMLNGETENAYAIGAKAFEESDEAKKEIQEINKKIYDRSDEKINELYDKGRAVSLEQFGKIYQKLGTKFDYFFFESQSAKFGKEIVEQNMKSFEHSDGAVVFKGENYDPKLHTRVFINSEGLPTYEAKELGLAKMKFDKYPYDKSIVITANEVNDYFKVLLEALKQIFPELAQKTVHLSHGILRLTTGKMSSRTGDVITAESLIEEVKEKVKGDEKVAIGAIKYMILRQAIGGDIIFDIEKSVSTEGDSGVYLQYAHARANSLLEKAGKSGEVKGERGNIHEVEKLLYRFPEIVERALEEFAPNYVTTYLTELSGAFNNFYAHEQVIGDSDEADYRLAIVEAFKIVIANGLNILGIPAPERM